MRDLERLLCPGGPHEVLFGFTYRTWSFGIGIFHLAWCSKCPKSGICEAIRKPREQTSVLSSCPKVSGWFTFSPPFRGFIVLYIMSRVFSCTFWEGKVFHLPRSEVLVHIKKKNSLTYCLLKCSDFYFDISKLEDCYHVWKINLIFKNL